jgi:LAGLIDADG endonuclease
LAGGGVIEGEGPLVISIVKLSKARYGILLQPEFNVTQHESGLNILNNFKLLFNNKGQVHKKSGSKNVWVYSLKGRSNLINYIIPFFNKYVICYSLKFNENNYQKFVNILNTLNKSPVIKNEYINLIKQVYVLNLSAKGKTRKRTVQEVINII